MSIKTPGTSESNTFKTSTPDLSGGFITNDATGLFEYDQVGAAPGGTPVGASMWDLIAEAVIVGNPGSITFSGLNGDIDKVYKIVMHIQQGGGAAAPLVEWRIRPNGIFNAATQQTTQLRLQQPGDRVAVFPGLIWSQLGSSLGVGAQVYFNAESGKVRTMRSRYTFRQIDHFNSGFWNDSTTVVTSLQLDNAIFPAGGGSSVWAEGERVRLYKLNR